MIKTTTLKVKSVNNEEILMTLIIPVIKIAVIVKIIIMIVVAIIMNK